MWLDRRITWKEHIKLKVKEINTKLTVNDQYQNFVLKRNYQTSVDYWGCDHWYSENGHFH